MPSTSIVSTPVAPVANEQTTVSLNACSVEEAAARIYAIVHGLWPVTLNSIRALNALQVVTRDIPEQPATPESDRAIRTEQAQERRERMASMREGGVS